jgi:type IX secretion system substrate protein/Big-like domain-containing protein
MKKYLFLTLATLLVSVASFAVGPILGVGGVCVGSNGTLSDTTGGTWSSSNSSVVTIGSTSGITYGVSPGTATISYTRGISIATRTYTVSAAPGPITGVLSECIGTYHTLSDAVGGGTWSTADYFIVAIGGGTGMDTAKAAGTDTILYTMGPGCFAYAIDTVVITPTPDSVYGPTGVCVGSTITMTDGTPGGVWSSSNTVYATIGTTGIVSGVSAGFTTISYAVTGTCGVAYAPVGYVSVSSVPVAGTISGATSVCVGSSVTLSDGISGGLWTSSNTSATVGSYSGVVTGVATGPVTISYTVTNTCGSATATYAMTVNPATSVSPITGASSLCAGATTPLTDATSGGVWSTASSTIATVGSTGIVTGIGGGTTNISYSVSGICGVTTVIKSITVNVPVIPVAITGPTSVCIGATITLSDATPGGTWSSFSTAVSLSGSCAVTGVSAGRAVIFYTVTGTCGSRNVTDTITVIGGPTAGVIGGASALTGGSTTTLTDAVTGGAWTSSNTLVASINPSTGLVTGVSTGSATITYTVTGPCGTAYATFVIAVTAANVISGRVHFTGAPYVGGVMVWLITYDAPTHMLTAVDSTWVSSTDSTADYVFYGKPTDSFRIKAADTATGSYGYIPTYHTSDFYWYTATVLSHVAGTVDAGQDIYMLYGAMVPGPGFIAGDVYLGANKGTGSIPSIGLQMYCVNAVTGHIIQQTTTDAAGHYSFSGLEVSASYYIHPEAGGYLTTDYPTITLTTAFPSDTTASFTQHTISHTITPFSTTGVTNLKSAIASLIAYPNPNSGKLNIKWQEPAAEQAIIVVSDIMGREVFRSSMDMSEGTGSNQIDLSDLTNGLYMISVKSPTISYISKIQVQR